MAFIIICTTYRYNRFTNLLKYYIDSIVVKMFYNCIMYNKIVLQRIIKIREYYVGLVSVLSYVTDTWFRVVLGILRLLYKKIREWYKIKLNF